jgi:hypothetical protein
MKSNVVKVCSAVLNLSEILGVSHRKLSSVSHVYGLIHPLAASVNMTDDGAYRNTAVEPHGMYTEVSC